MNGRERLLNTLTNKPVDRVPVAPFTYYNAIYEMFEYTPRIATFFDPPDFDPVAKFVEFCDNFGFDVLHVLGSVWDLWVGDSKFDRGWACSDENWDVDIQDEFEGDNRLQRTITIHTPAGALRHVEQHERTSKYLIVSAAKEHLIKATQDFDLLQRYAPPADRMDTSLVTRARAATGDKGLVTANTHGTFNILGLFRKLEDVLTDPLTDPGFYQAMVDYFKPRLADRARRMVAAGADVIEMAGHWTGQVGPRVFHAHILENENWLVREIHKLGVPVIYHNCGDAARIMRYYNELEIDCWGYLTPPPFADVVLEDALAVLRPSLALRGNIDQMRFLMDASPQEVKDKVRQVLETVKPRGNFILSTTDFFFDGTPYENIRALGEAGREFGWY